MGLFSRLFGKKQSTDVKPAQQQTPAVPKSEEAFRFLEYTDFMEKLLNTDYYVSRKEYLQETEKYQEIIQYFSVLKKSDMLSEYCRKNGMDEKRVETQLGQYERISELVEKHNDDFVRNTMAAEKDYFDTILKDVDPQIQLDDDQRRVVLTDEDYCLVVAGAGAGKTTTVAAKVKYLIEKKNIDPKQILVVTFTNKAVKELRDKINKALNIQCPIATFHSVGSTIIRQNSDDDKLNIADGSKLFFCVRDYFKSSVLKKENVVNKLILFFASYFDAPYEGDDLNAFFNNIAKSNFTTMRSDLEDFKREIIDTRTKKKITIQNEVVRSHQEVEIANFLYLNGIDYDYEPLYPYDIAGSRKPYTPDFIIYQGDNTAYIEHFGINEDGTHFLYNEDELEAYKKAVNDKVRLHRQHGTKLLYTFSGYRDRRTLREHLQELLEKNGFILKPKSNEEIMQKLVSGEENKYIWRLVHLVCRFITNFKVNGYVFDDFNRMYHATQNVRSRLFLEICSDCYLEYERYLKENNAVDFQDMINESARILREVQEMRQKLDYKYVIVDEYQDISRQRFDLTKALSDITDAKIIAVGDDWQSIYAFSGSDITLFTKFAESVGYAKQLKIVKTYRNSQEVIDIAGNFIQKNTEQIRKTLRSPKNITDPVIIYTYDATYKKPNADRRTGANYALAAAVETALSHIVEQAKKENKKPGTVLLLGRYSFDGDRLEKTGLFEYKDLGSKVRSIKYPEMKITFMTVHSSKGLGYDNVIVLNGRNEIYGFPSKIEDDPVLSFVIHGDHSIDYAEERRLFYVAMTRTKNRVYFVAPEKNPSEFLLEIKHDYKNVSLCGTWNEESPKNLSKKSCPICGYPMQFRYKNAYGLRLYMCTNEPEICGFMTNEVKAGKMSIMKCNCCRDGYLIVKPGKIDGYFLGCTNYQKSGKGCNNVISKKEYYDSNGLELEQEQPIIKEVPSDPAPAVQPRKSEYTPNRSEAVVTIIKPVHKPVMYKDFDLNDVLFTVLQALEHISEVHYYGSVMMQDVLLGSEKERLTKAGLHLLPEYGALRTLPRGDIITIIEWMIDNHFMLRTKGQYPVLHPTVEGRNYQENITPQKLKKLKAILEDKDADKNDGDAMVDVFSGKE